MSVGIGTGKVVGPVIGVAMGVGVDLVSGVGVGMPVGVCSGSTQMRYKILGPAIIIVIGLAVLSEPSGISPSQRRKSTSQLAVAIIVEPRSYI